MVREAFVDDPSVSAETLRTADCLDAVIGRETPDMVIVGVDAAAVAVDRIVPCDLLLKHRGFAVLGLSTDGRLAWMCELWPSARSLREALHPTLQGRRRWGAEAPRRCCPWSPGIGSSGYILAHM